MSVQLKSSTAMVPVTAAMAFDPRQSRSDFEMPYGVRISDIVHALFPRATDSLLARVRVHLVSEKGTVLIPGRMWHAVTPHAGVHVVIRLVAGKNALKSILQIFVTIAASFLAPYVVGFLGLTGFAAQIGTALATLAITTAGMLLINALIPPPRAPQKDSPTFATSGFRNQLDPGGIVPAVVGKHRMAPPYAAYPYAEIVGDLQYQRCLFCVGYGPVAISDLKIGDTAVEDYDEVEVEVREGYPDDTKLSLFPQQIIEEQFNVDLRYERPRDDLGEYISGSSPEETPVLRVSAGDAASVNVLLLFPGGLVNLADGSKKNRSVTVRIRTRPLGEAAWENVDTITIRNNSTEAFFRVHSVSFAERGRHEIEVTRRSQNSTSAQVSDRMVLASIQSVRPEYPLNVDRPLAVIAVRVKATYQLNGGLDNFNCVVSRIAPDYDAASGNWIERETRNPASLGRWILTTLSVKPVPVEEIDDEQWADFHAFCAANNLHYDMVLGEERSLFEQLLACMAAGRASPRWDGVKWGVVIDRPETLVVDHVNDRNARALQWQRSFVTPPHAFRVPFFDSSNDYQTAERLVPWPGHIGDITIIEELELPGKTDPDEVWIEARRRQYEVIHRAERFTAIQDGALRVLSRGDRAMASFSALSRTLFAARVKDVSGYAVELDTEVTLPDDEDFAVRFRVNVSEENPLGESVVVPVLRGDGQPSNMMVLISEPLPLVGDIVHIGIATQDSVPVVVAAVEAGDDMSSVLTMVPVADEIDRLTNLEEPPAWDARVGDIFVVIGVAPPVPKIVSVLTGVSGTGQNGGIEVNVQPGAGAGAPVDRYRIEYRIQGAPDWIVETVNASAGGIVIDGYANGDIMEMRIAALAADDTQSAYGPIVSFTVGENDAQLPEQLTIEQGNFTGALGSLSALFATGSNTVQISIYRQSGTGGTLDKNNDLDRTINVAANTSGQFVLGDLTVIDLAQNGTFDSDSDWTKGAGWTIASGIATHASGAAGILEQTTAVALSNTKTYVVSGAVAGRTAGNLTPLLTGTSKLGAAMSENGVFAQTIIAEAAHTGFGFSASDVFDGSIDLVSIYQQTPACLDPGFHTIWLEPLNEDGAAGAVSGPFEIFVR